MLLTLPPSSQGWATRHACQPGKTEGGGPVHPGAFSHAPTCGMEKLRHPTSSYSLEASFPDRSQSGNQPAPCPRPCPFHSPGPEAELRLRPPGGGRERKMSFPAARWRWRCQLIRRGRGPRAGLGASLAAAGAQLSGKNWGGCCGEISYRSLGGAAGPRSALTAADPGRAPRRGGV